MSEVRLNLGAGDTVIDGWTPIDRRLGTEVYPLSYADNSVDEIRASHILEHFGWNELEKVLLDWVRVLKPGGRIRIAVPDIEKIMSGDFKNDRLRYHYLMGGQMDSDDFHRSAWDRSLLAGAMEAVGLKKIAEWHCENTDTASHPCSLRLEGYKPSEDTLLKIAAVTSIPRVGWNDHWGCVQQALSLFGIPLRRYTGAFWGQLLQNAFEEAIEDGLDWVLTLDYDSMFNKHHVDAMLGLFGNNPHIDALAALQSRRSQPYPLMTIKDQPNNEVELTSDAPIKVTTAHFGMTLIRLDVLREVPKPWFQGHPGKSGSYRDDERLDEDIWFWHQWRLAGKSLYMAPSVRIGHLELMVSQFTSDMDVEHIYIKDWLDKYQPELRKKRKKPCESNS